MAAAAAAAIALPPTQAGAAPAPAGGATRPGVGAEASAHRLAGLRDGRIAPAAARAWRTPLGSTWKLFVHAWLVERGEAEPPYRCAAVQPRSDEEYCCDPGGSVGRDAALARSCGPYFDPVRLAIPAEAWRTHWQARGAPGWLQDLAALRPDTEVAVGELLAAVDALPTVARRAARAALLPNTLRDSRLLDALGSGPRFKTWSWTASGRRVGGALGWRGDGAPFWFGAPGTSRTALARDARWIAARWAETPAADGADGPGDGEAPPCVEVAMFDRYPLRAVERPDGTPVAPGPLAGPVQLRFDNGNRLAFDAGAGLRLVAAAGAPPRIAGRFLLDDYVARVIDREGDARETAAARALAVAARSWLVQNAPAAGGCHRTVDASRTQRVAPAAPSAAARAAAAFTRDLVLTGSDVRYHRDAAAPGVMAWTEAVRASRGGAGFEAILQAAYPGATLAGLDAAAECARWPEAAAWLAGRERAWRERLRAEPGFEPVAARLQVCRLGHGTSYSDQRRLAIHLGDWAGREGRVTLIHEYLHLAFAQHPNGRDEAWVERFAQELADR